MPTSFNGLIFRKALSRLGSAFGIRGGFKGPDNIRSESGLYLMTDVMESLSQGETSFGFSDASATAGAADTTATAEISFVGDVLVLGIQILGSGFTNLSFVSVNRLDRAGVFQANVFTSGTPLHDPFRVTSPGRRVRARVNDEGRTFPFYLPAGEHIELLVRSDAVGAVAEITMIIATASAPEGITVLHP